MSLAYLSSDDQNVLIISINSRKELELDLALFKKLVLGFICFTIIGTLSHEAGHLLVGRALGYKGGLIHYGSTSIGHSSTVDSLHSYRQKFRFQLNNNHNFPEKEIINILVVAE